MRTTGRIHRDYLEKVGGKASQAEETARTLAWGLDGLVGKGCSGTGSPGRPGSRVRALGLCVGGFQRACPHRLPPGPSSHDTSHVTLFFISHMGSAHSPPACFLPRMPSSFAQAPLALEGPAMDTPSPGAIPGHSSEVCP